MAESTLNAEQRRALATPGKKPVTGPVWLLLGLAAVLLAAMTRKAYGRPFPRQTNGPQR